MRATTAAVAAIVGALALSSSGKVLQEGDGAQISFSSSARQIPDIDLRAAPPSRIPVPAAGYFYFSESGHVIGYPESLRVFYDPSAYNASSINVAVIGSKAASSHHLLQQAEWSEGYECRDVESTFEFANVFGCPNSHGRTGYGILEYHLTASIDYIDPASGSKSKTIENVLTVVLRPLAEWPLENELGVWPPSAPNAVANLFEDYQTFGGISDAYWHQGLDIRSEVSMSDGNKWAGKVHSPVDGKVVKIVQYRSSVLYWSLMIEDSYGFIWQFHHLDSRSFRVVEGEIIQAGRVLGNVILWPASQNKHKYHHTHMNVVRPHSDWSRLPEPYVDGWQYYNPYDFLNQHSYKNEIKPYSDGIMYFFEHGESAAFASSLESKIIVSNTVDIVLHFASEFNQSNTVPGYPYILGIISLSWSVRPVMSISKIFEFSPTEASAFEQIQSRYLLNMHRMGPNWSPCMPDLTVSCSNAFLVNIHRQKFRYRRRKYQSVFDYDTRKVYYSVTNGGQYGYPMHENESPNASGWNTREILPSGVARFPDGEYEIAVTARDWFKNEATVTRKVWVRNGEYDQL